MTTIAFDGVGLSGDGRVVEDDTIVSDTDCKVFRIRGVLYGVSGHADQCDSFIEWLRKGSKGRRPKIKDVTYMMVGPDGKPYVSDGGGKPIEHSVPAAIGSGAEAARGAMLSGLNSAQAIRRAALVKNTTGGQIRTLKLARKR